MSIDPEAALERAGELDDEHARLGAVRGPLFGIPIGIKDIVDLEGLPTIAAWPPWRHRIAAADAPLVQKLRAAGAVIVGKTVTTQFAAFDPSVTRNPRNRAWSPGGSSSGSAAAVASGMCLAAVGSQTGGSITRPASYCGVAGVKPRYGELDDSGFVPLAPSLDHPGFIAPTAADLALLWSALMPKGPAIQPPYRIGLLHGFFEAHADPEQYQAISEWARAIPPALAVVSDVDRAIDCDELLRLHRTVMYREVANVHAERYQNERPHFLPRLAAVIAEGLTISDDCYASARLATDRICSELRTLFDAYDYLAAPATPGFPPGLESTGSPMFSSMWSLLGWPLASFPIAQNDAGAPIAVQLIGPRNAGSVLDAAAALELGV